MWQFLRDFHAAVIDHVDNDARRQFSESAEVAN